MSVKRRHKTLRTITVWRKLSYTCTVVATQSHDLIATVIAISVELLIVAEVAATVTVRPSASGLICARLHRFAGFFEESGHYPVAVSKFASGNPRYPGSDRGGH